MSLLYEQGFILISKNVSKKKRQNNTIAQIQQQKFI